MADQSSSRMERVLQLAGRVTLGESDTAYVGKIGGIAFGGDGSLYIADLLNATVLRFDRTGAFRQKFSRRGRGPGELMQPGALAVSGDSLLFVVNGGFELNAFTLPDGAFRWKRFLPMRPVFVLGASRAGLLFGANDSTKKAVLGIVTGSADSARYAGPYPSPLGRSRAVDAWYSYAKFASWSDDSVALAVEASDYLFWGALNSPRFDSIEIPRIRRRGSRPDLYRHVTPDPSTMRPLLYKTSHPWALARLPTGTFAYVVTDQVYARNRFSGSMFLSLIDPRSRTVCSDIPLPAPRDPQPWVAFSGDTLLVVWQDVNSAGKAFAGVTRYLVRFGNCERSGT